MADDDSLLHRQMVLKRQASDQTQQSCCSCSGNLNLGRIWEEAAPIWATLPSDHSQFGSGVYPQTPACEIAVT
jgi:hypothetical protein